MPVTAQPPPADIEAARFNMVESQIRPNKVRSERLLDAFSGLPREMFVPSMLAGIAYIDKDLPVADGRYLLEPMVLARLLEEGGIRPNDRVLDIAPATGYSTALLAQLAREVVAVENEAALAGQAMENLARLGIGNASVKQGPFADGWRGNAPYDVILVNGSAEFVPEELMAQLAEGGRLLIVMREFGPARIAHKGEARLYEKIRGAVSHRALFDANVRPLADFAAKQKFSF
jgi:protein-L-isoaspartate(D-aspartate) O-methyltransferase